MSHAWQRKKTLNHPIFIGNSRFFVDLHDNNTVQILMRTVRLCVHLFCNFWITFQPELRSIFITSCISIGCSHSALRLTQLLRNSFSIPQIADPSISTQFEFYAISLIQGSCQSSLPLSDVNHLIYVCMTP